MAAIGKAQEFQRVFSGTTYHPNAVGEGGHGHGKVDHDAFMLVRVPAA